MSGIFHIADVLFVLKNKLTVQNVFFFAKALNFLFLFSLSLWRFFSGVCDVFVVVSLVINVLVLDYKTRLVVDIKQDYVNTSETLN